MKEFVFVVMGIVTSVANAAVSIDLIEMKQVDVMWVQIKVRTNGPGTLIVEHIDRPLGSSECFRENSSAFLCAALVPDRRSNGPYRLADLMATRFFVKRDQELSKVLDRAENL